MSHIVKLGATAATLREYTTEKTGDGIAWERGPASPFAARVNSSGKYDEIDIWNEWVQEDWQAGVGRVDPEAGGYLFSTLETRVPNQLILPPQVQQCDKRDLNATTADCRYIPDDIAGTITWDAPYAVPFTTPSAFVGDGSEAYYFYARIGSSVEVNIEIWSNSGGSPGTLLDSGSVQNREANEDFRWYGVNIPTTSITTSTLYWLVFDVSDTGDEGNTAELAYGTSGFNTESRRLSGTWAAVTGKYILYATGHHALGSSVSEKGVGIFRFNGNLYSYRNERLYKLDTANNNFNLVGTTITGAGDITSHAIFGPTVYFARSSGNYTTMDTSEVFAAASVQRTLFLEYDGVLYSTLDNDLYVSSDGSTWSAAYPVGGDDVDIRGMAGMGDSLYLATDKALYRFAPGSIVEETTRFGSEDASNGVGMIEYQGRLYIPAGGRLFRFDPSGQMMDIWVNRDDDLPLTKVGEITTMARMNNWLVVYSLADGAPNPNRGHPSLWVWQEEGWHFLANVYSRHEGFAETYQALYYDRGTSRLWFTSDMGSLQYVKIDDYTINPFHLGVSYVYMPFAWLQQDRFYGGQYLLDKSWESVTIVGDNLSTNVNVKVYWQDEGSPVDIPNGGIVQWEVLGTATNDGQELRWSDYDTRPNGKWIRLAVRLQTNDGTETPRIRAIIVKFLPMVNDRIRDNVTITLHDYVEMPDGTPDAYTLAQQLAHIQSLIESVDPIIYEDPFHDQYEVTVVDWRMSALLYDSVTGVTEIRCTFVLEQLPDEQYA